jgi:AraC family transcriptional regulator of adaptative response/methylated-DNA-[protein]-cysteine methyltransferase
MRSSGDTVRFATGRCWLGAILVACTDRGACAILLGDEPDTLIGDLRKRFPDTELVPDGADAGGMLTRVVRLIDAPAGRAEFALDLRGTPFEQRVWRALMEIPAGTTASYGDVARRIGEPAMAREVAEACAANPLAVAVPCHRVVRVDGSISGYRWGVRRKRALLRREAETSPLGPLSAGSAAA